MGDTRILFGAQQTKVLPDNQALSDHRDWYLELFFVTRAERDGVLTRVLGLVSETRLHLENQVGITTDGVHRPQAAYHFCCNVVAFMRRGLYGGASFDLSKSARSACLQKNPSVTNKTVDKLF